MKTPFVFFIPLIFMALLWLSLRSFPDNSKLVNTQFENFKELPKKTPSRNTYQQVIYKGGKKSWRPVVDPFLSSTSRQKKDQQIKQNLNSLKKFDKNKLNPCNHFRYLRIENRLNNRLLLGDTPHLPMSNVKNILEKISFSKMKNRKKQSYSKRIKTYLGLDIPPQEMITYGENELAKSLANLANFEQTLIDQGLASSIETFEKNHATTFVTEKDIIAAANLRRPIIARNMPRLFYAYEIPAANVIASLKTKRLYAVGSYRNNNFTFYWDGQTFLAKDLDYLMLHELVPGHHLQITNARINPICKSKNTFNYANLSVFTEGWATYIETLGPELGLLRTPEQQLGKLDWDLIRAIRVILDVRIHHDGWSNVQVKTYWDTHMPERLHYLAKRETKRMHKMPMQAITYKVGADAILKLKQSEMHRLGDDFDIRKFHDVLLRMGSVPINILDDSYAALIK